MEEGNHRPQTWHAFSVLSLNTFGLPFFLGWRRLVRLADELKRLPATMLCLQEIQQNAYVPLLIHALPDFPHHAYEYNFWTPKGGLLNLARLPLVSQQFVPFQERGRLWSVGFSDWALFKGVLVTHLQVGGQRVIVLNTHLQANYAGRWASHHYQAQIQRRQVHQLAATVREQPAQALVVVCGDLNFPPGTFLYEELLSEGGLTDPLADDPRPTYRPLPFVSSRWSTSLDFMLVRLPIDTAVRLSADIIGIENSKARWPWQRFLTDHNALLLRVEWPQEFGSSDLLEEKS